VGGGDIRQRRLGSLRRKQKRIFEPFFSTKDIRGGTGLGLSIAASIVRQHAGTIELQSELGTGTTFTIRFPAQAPRGETFPQEVGTA